MAIEVVMPRLGWTAEEGILKEWLQPSGARISAGDPLFTVEGDKAVEEIDSLDNGILHIPPDSPSPGQSAPVGTVLAFILAEGESPPSVEPSTLSSGPSQAVDADRKPFRETASDAAATSEAIRKAISPRARKLARELGVDWSRLQGSGRTGRIVTRDVQAAAQTGSVESELSPVARRLAQDLDLSLAELAAAFPNRRITAAMVRGFAARPEPEVERIEPFSSMRRTIAANLMQSVSASAPVTLTTELDAAEMVKLRKQLKADNRENVPSYTELFLKILAFALEEFPRMNATVLEGAIRLNQGIHIGLAVEVAGGLRVPVVHNANRLNLGEIHATASRLIERAQSGAISAEEMEGGTFTLTNLGAWEVDCFTPILPPGHTAILGMGRIGAKAMVKNPDTGEVGMGQAMSLSLTFDHRAVDGAPAARFLQRVKRYAETPYLWLAR